MQLDSAKRILITGGAGFIGSALVRALNERGLENLLLTDVLGSDEKWRNLVPLRFDEYLDAADFRARLEEAPDSLGQFDCIFHLGACSATTERDAGYLLENNYRYTRFLCEWALARESRFIYASSAATYGDGAHGMDDTVDIRCLRPLNAYGYSKQLFDLIAQRKGWLDRIVGLKYFNVFGPNEFHKGEMRSLVCKAYEQVVQTGEIRLFKSHRPDYRDGEQMRDFVYVRDAVEMTLHLAETDQAAGLFNIGNAVARTWIDLATAIFTALGKPPRITFIDMPESIREQYQYYTCANVARLQSTGYARPNYTLESAVREYVVDYLVPGRRLGE